MSAIQIFLPIFLPPFLFPPFPPFSLLPSPPASLCPSLPKPVRTLWPCKENYRKSEVALQFPSPFNATLKLGGLKNAENYEIHRLNHKTCLYKLLYLSRTNPDDKHYVTNVPIGVRYIQSLSKLINLFILFSVFCISTTKAGCPAYVGQSITEGLSSPSLFSSPLFSVLLNVCFKMSVFDRCLNPYSRILHCLGNCLKSMTANPNHVPFSKCFLILTITAFCQLVSFSTSITVLAKCYNFVHCTFGNHVNQHLAQE